MSETTNTPQENVQESVQEPVQQAPAFNPFADSAWAETPDFANNPAPEPSQEPAATSSPDILILAVIAILFLFLGF